MTPTCRFIVNRCELHKRCPYEFCKFNIFLDIVFKTTTQPTQEVRPVPGPDTDVLSRPDMIMETLDEAENFFEEEICGAPKPRRRQQKPVIKISWTEEEELEIKRLLKGFFEHKKRPKPVDCARAIEKSRKNNGVIWKRKKDVLKKKVFRMIDSLKL